MCISKVEGSEKSGISGVVSISAVLKLKNITSKNPWHFLSESLVSLASKNQWYSFPKPKNKFFRWKYTRRQLRSLMNWYSNSNATIIALSKEMIYKIFERDDLLNYTAFNGHRTPRSVRRELATTFEFGQDLEWTCV